MKGSTICAERRIVLEMDEEEAGKLMAMVQNPFSSDEAKEISELRIKIWNALESQGIRPR